MSFSKKIFIISSSLLAVILLLWGIYYLSFNKPGDNAPAQKETSSQVAPSDQTAGEKIHLLTQEPVLGSSFVQENHSIKYYSRENGKIYQIDSSGAGKKTLSDKELPGLVSVLWSPNKTKVISKFSRENGQFQYFYYDFIAGKGTPLKNNLDFVIWQNNNKIFYKYYDPESQERSLNIANPDGTDWKKITDIAFKDIFIAPIPQSGLVSFWTKPDAYLETALQSVSIAGQNSKSLFTGKFGADYLWNNDGTKILLSHSDGRGGSKTTLAVINSRGGEYRRLEIPTFASKAAWSKDNKTVYYALPGSMPEGVILPNDYSAGKFKTTDTFWKVDTETGKKERVVELDKIKGQFDATEMFLNYDESMLFFINKTDGKLYRLDL